MDTLKDIWASLVAGVQERTTNPLTFSFIASWCLCNFKFFFILAGDGTTAERLLAVDELFPFTWSTYLGHAFGLPLSLACLYVFAYPSVSARVIESYRRKQVAIANKVREVEGTRVRTVEETARLTRDHETELAAWQEREAKLQQQLQLAKEALAAAEREIADILHTRPTADVQDPPTMSYRETIDWLDKKPPVSKATASTGAELFLPAGNGAITVTEAERDIITLLGNSSRGLSSGQIAQEINRTHSVATISLDALSEKGIARDFGGNMWELTPSGHRLVVDMAK